MGVDVTTYLMYGIVLNEEQNKYVKENWSKDDLPLIKYVEGRPETERHILLVDFMSGVDPTIFGKVLSKSSGQEGGINKITIPDYQDKKKLMDHFLKCFPKQFKFENELDMMIVTRYS